MALPTREAFLAQLNSQDCPICYEPIAGPVKTSCGHIFCLECAKTWFSTSPNCPSCRTPMFREPTPLERVLQVERLDFGLQTKIDREWVTGAMLFFAERPDWDALGFQREHVAVVDTGKLMHRMAAAVLWLKPDGRDRTGGSNSTAEDRCRDEWITTAKCLERALLQCPRHLPCHELEIRLTVYWEARMLVTYGNIPNYSGDDLSNRSFAQDVAKVIHWIVLLAYAEALCRPPPSPPRLVDYCSIDCQRQIIRFVSCLHLPEEQWWPEYAALATFLLQAPPRRADATGDPALEKEVTEAVLELPMSLVRSLPPTVMEFLVRLTRFLMLFINKEELFGILFGDEDDDDDDDDDDDESWLIDEDEEDDEEEEEDESESVGMPDLEAVVDTAWNEEDQTDEVSALERLADLFLAENVASASDGA